MPKKGQPQPRRGSERQRPGAVELSLRQARRLALAAQGFGRRRPAGRVDVRHIRRVLGDVALLQIDSVNVLSRAHYLPLFARLGPYPREAIDRLAYHRGGLAEARIGGPAEKRELFEYWAHEASLLPVELQPLLRWRMARVDELAWGSMVRIGREQPALVEWVLEQVRERGPLRASELRSTPRPGTPGEMWNWSEEKVALERLFFSGRVSAAGRHNFERLYDLPERVLPAAVLAAPTPAPADAQRQLTTIAARALGVATEPELGDYFRLPRADSKARVAELVEEGALIEARVEGWARPAYLPADGRRRAAAVRARALLAPFDSLIWNRERDERLFDFHYRIGIYTPAAKRTHGYYVLPFLLGERLVGRVDLKADRAAGALRVLGAFAEEGADRAEAVVELAAELVSMAAWLGLERGVTVARKGDLAAGLRAALGAAPGAG